jgi:hypothetical protein
LKTQGGHNEALTAILGLDFKRSGFIFACAGPA